MKPTDIVLETKGLTKTFGGNAVLRGVDITLHRGEVVLLQGANGSGKTTLLNILTGSLQPDAGTMRHTASLGRTWQDVRLFSSQTLEENLAMAAPHQPGENPLKAIFFPWRTRAAERQNQKEIRQILSDAGLADRAHVLAGAAKVADAKFVALMRALRAGAQVIFLDEPLAGLDQAEIAVVIKTLQTLVLKHGLTLVIIEHALNIPKILQIATTVWTLKDGKLAIGDPKMPEVASDGDMMSWLKSFALNGVVREISLPKGARLMIASRKPNAKPVLELANYTVSRGAVPVIDEPISFMINEGDVAILEAPNGWGKTSLLESISGLTSVTDGLTFLWNTEVSKKPVWQRAQCGLRLNRPCGAGFDRVTVSESIQLNHVIESDVAACIDRQVESLSGGERRRLSFFATMNNSCANILLLDEPFYALDVTELTRMRKQLSHSIKTVLLAIPSVDI